MLKFPRLVHITKSDSKGFYLALVMIIIFYEYFFHFNFSYFLLQGDNATKTQKFTGSEK